MAEQQGLLLQCLGGFYYVETPQQVYVCRGRGVLRRESVTPVAGDRVRITVGTDGTGTVDDVLPRRNRLLRPPLANLDRQVIVVSAARPAPNRTVLDTMLVMAHYQGIEPLLVFSKTDLADVAPLAAVYRAAGYTVLEVSREDPQSVRFLKKQIVGKVSAFTGNTGVGKSSLLNLLDPTLTRATGEISDKLGRGRHTTRSVQLLPLHEGGYVADTPGFSSLDVTRELSMTPMDLAGCLPEMQRFSAQCRFQPCTHIHEPGCAVRAAVEDGTIAPSRYESYTLLFRDLQKTPAWEPKKLPRGRSMGG